MKNALFLFLLLIGCFAATAQKINESTTYTTAVGAKVFDGGGVSVKHFFKGNNAAEGILYFWGKGAKLTGLYEIHGPLKDFEGMKWYIGAGGHFGFFNNDNGGGAFIGVDGVIGLDYKVKGAPINVSFDWNPNIDLGANNGFNAGAGGLGVRFTF
jgi:hypothetical protein